MNATQNIDELSELLDWYRQEVRPSKSITPTFGQAISKLEDIYWSSATKKRQQRDRTSASHQATYHAAYGRFYALLPADKLFNSKDLLAVLATKPKGCKVYGDCLYALKRLALIAEHKQSIDELEKINHVQTEFRHLQNAELDTFLQWMRNCIAQANDRYYHRRKQWLWVFSMQLVYGLRVHEVFAIANITEPFRTSDGITIPALQAPNNTRMIAVVSDTTEMGTTTKTGYRLAAPMLPPSHPNLIEELDIRGGILPEVKSSSSKASSVAGRYNHSARAVLLAWGAPITQTHALRHLANQNGKQAGITAEDRAANMGHSVAMNTQTYLKREATNTRLAAIDAQNSRILPLEGAIAALRRIGATAEAIAVVSEIYGVSAGRVMSELN